MLQAISDDIYEVADAAPCWHSFRKITLPLLMPTTCFLLVVSVIEAFQIFTIVDVMTMGGPAGGTDELYRVCFSLFDIGQGSALAIVLFVFLVVLTFVKSCVLGKKVHHEA